jgi:hypothetical protein
MKKGAVMIAPISWMAVFCIENKSDGKRGSGPSTSTCTPVALYNMYIQERCHMDPETSDALQLQSEILGNLILKD